MPRAVDPPGRYPQADYDPASRDLLFDPLTLPKFDWCNFLKETLHNGITWLTDVISTFTCGRVNLQPLHEVLDELWVEFVTGLQRGTLVISLISRGLWIVNNGLGLEWQQVIDAWSRFSETWFGLDWLHDPIGSVQAGFAALVTLICDLGRWLAEVIANLINIRVPAFFALEQLQHVITTFVDDWRAINWLNVLAIAANLRAALSAILTLAGGIVDWAITVLRNIAGIDMRDLFSAFALPQLRDVFNTLTSTIQGINWLALPAALRTAFGAGVAFLKGVIDWAITVLGNFGVDLRSLFSAFMFPQLRERLAAFFDTLASINWWQAGALMTAIGAVVTVVKDIGNWLLAVLTNFFGDGVETIRQMFASLTSFVDTLVKFFLGDGALLAWRNALDLLAGIVGASPIDAIMGLYGKLQDLLSMDLGDILAQIKDLIGGGLGDLMQNLLGGLIPIGNLTGENPNMLEGVGKFPAQANIAENPYWTWDPNVTLVPDGTGSARVDADGTVKALRSQRFTVAPGGALEAEILVRWQNLTTPYDGISSLNGESPIMLQLLPSSGDSILAPVSVDNLIAPIQADNPGAYTLKTWPEWTVPDGVDGVRMRLYVSDNAKSGRIWWDHAILKRTGGILQGIIDTIWSAFTGLPGIGKTLADLRTAAAGMFDRVNGVIDQVHGLIDDLWSAFTGLFDFDPGKTLEDLKDAAAGIADGVRGLIDELWASFTQVFNQPGKTLQDLADAAVNAIAGPGGVIQTVKNIISGIFGIDVRDISHDQAGLAVDSLASSVESNRLALEAFKNTFTSGVSVQDDFQRVANSLGANWNATYTTGAGDMRTNGTAYWQPSAARGNGDGTFVWQGSPASSQTDYQEVGIVLAGGAGVSWPVGNTGHNDVVVRWALNNYVRWRVGGDRTWQLVYFIGGNMTVVTSGTLPYAPAKGTFVKLRAGDLATVAPRRFQGLLGSDVIFTWNDTGNVTAMGAGNRGWGMGARAEGVTLLSQWGPAPISQWLAKDQ